MRLAKQIEESRLGGENESFRTIKWFKAGNMYRKIVKKTSHQEREEYIRTILVYIVGMNKKEYLTCLTNFLDATKINDVGRMCFEMQNYEKLLRERLIASNFGNIARMLALGQNTSTKYSTNEPNAIKKEFQERKAVYLAEKPILNPEEVVETSKEYANEYFSEGYFLTMLLGERTHAIAINIENKKRKNAVEFYNMTRYKHNNVIHRYKRKYAKKIADMEVSEKRYLYLLENVEILRSLYSDAKYREKNSLECSLIDTLQSLTTIKRKRDNFAILHLDSAPVCTNYQCFYDDLLIPHIDKIKDFYDEEALEITNIIEKCCENIPNAMRIPKIVTKVQKGKKVGCIVDSGEMIKLRKENVRYELTGTIRPDLSTLSSREKYTLDTDCSKMTKEEIVADVMNKLINISTSSSCSKAEIRKLAAMLDESLKREK